MLLLLLPLLLPAGKGAAAAAVKLVPQPVNKKVLVPPPTEDEKRRNVSAVSFAVERIMGHKVCVGVCKRGGYSVCVCGGGVVWVSRRAKFATNGSS